MNAATVGRRTGDLDTARSEALKRLNEPRLQALGERANGVYDPVTEPTLAMISF